MNWNYRPEASARYCRPIFPKAVDGGVLDAAKGRVVPVLQVRQAKLRAERDELVGHA